MHYDVITIGGATEDITFYTDQGVIMYNKDSLTEEKLLAFEFGAKIKIDKTIYTFGGGASNASVALSRLGFKVSIIAAIGHDERGRQVVDNFHHHGVSTKFIQRIANSETGYSFVLIGPGNEHIAFVSRGANTLLKIGREDNEALRNTDWIYISSLSGDWETVLDKVFAVQKAMFFWNPGLVQLEAGMQGLKKYLEQTTVLQLNKEEAEKLAASDQSCAERGKEFLEDTVNLLKIIKKQGPHCVVITEGSEGAKAFDGKKIYIQKSLTAKRVVDTTGVGDAFGASFVAGLELYNDDIKKALHLAARNAASVVQKQGAQHGLLTKKEAIG
jgi:sugar/nucleoside kinase (ribokinase family)